ncbi:Squalene/phytoene desaturase HopC [hydrothermal vent metagenome]|uniref:Squalene/phytoene desaturase HopC n=1 Tax=hydrothermal vent metagenome TaxID=652676 RepID=A0A3B1A6I7_9ZZZZ
MDTIIKKIDILIIGGGWAGLSTAIKLVDSGKNIYLIESAKQLGGRAREVQVKQTIVDNGTHIMIGAYTETLRLIQKVFPSSGHYSEKIQLKRENLALNYKQILKPAINLPRVPLPAPFNIIGSFLFARGLSAKDKLCVLALGTKIKLNLIKLPSDLALQAFFEQQKQTETVIKSIWEPLCLAIMNTPLKQASTEIFLHVLKESFFKSRHASDLLFFKTTLSEIFPMPAEKYITQHGGEILLEQKAISIQQKNDFYLITTPSLKLQTKHVVIATPPPAANKLLTELNTQQTLEPLINNLNQFTYQAICTVYLQYPKTIQCERNMQGFLGTTSQWMFDKKNLTHQPGLVSIIISSAGPHLEMDNPSLIKTITEELARFYPQWPEPLDAFVIREKRATFTASVNINRIRPANRTVMDNLWLAGDYTNTQYPATLEGAVRSGLHCAQQILAE